MADSSDPTLVMGWEVSFDVSIGISEALDLLKVQYDEILPDEADDNGAE